MKKFLLSTIAALVSTVICFAFVGCKEDGTLGDGIVSDTVTEEVWKSALAEENFKNFKAENKNISEISDRTVTTKSTFTVDGNKTLMQAELSSGNISRSYSLYSDGNVKYENLNNKGWTSASGGHMESSTYIIDISLLIIAQNRYGDFQYDENAGGYSLKENSEFANIGNTNGFKFAKLIFKFKDGKLAYAEMKREVTLIGEPYRSVENKALFTFGGQTVETPDISE